MTELPTTIACSECVSSGNTAALAIYMLPAARLAHIVHHELCLRRQLQISETSTAQRFAACPRSNAARLWVAADPARNLPCSCA